MGELVRAGEAAWGTGRNGEGEDGVFREGSERESSRVCMVVVRVPRNDGESYRGVVESEEQQMGHLGSKARGRAIECIWLLYAFHEMTDQIH